MTTVLIIQLALLGVAALAAWHVARKVWRAVFPRTRRAEEG